VRLDFCLSSFADDEPQSFDTNLDMPLWPQYQRNIPLSAL